jgi:hypothetical protein
MKNGTAITVIKSSNGFVVFEQNNPELPADASLIAGFTELTNSLYNSKSVMEFIKDHFEPRQESAPAEPDDD